MSRHKVPFAVERFRAHPDVLAEKLKIFGVRLQHRDHGFHGCTLYLDDDGDYVREIGHLCHWLEGPQAGLVHVWPRSDAKDAERIILLRAAELAQRDGADLAGWVDASTPTKGYAGRRTTILVILSDANGETVDRAVARVPEEAWEVEERQHATSAQMAE